MTSSFVDWHLSSSESEEEGITHGVLLNVKNIKKRTEKLDGQLDISDVYVPLSERLKIKDSKSAIDSDDDLPEFTLPSPCRISNKENLCSANEGRIHIVESKNGNSLISDDDFFKSKTSPKVRRKNFRLHEKEIEESGVNHETQKTEMQAEGDKQRVKSKNGYPLISSMNDSDGDFRKRKTSPKPRRKSLRLCEKVIEKSSACPESQKTGAAMQKVQNQSKKEDSTTKRKALNSHLKTLKPEECMKYMECQISSLMVGMFSDIDFLRELQNDFGPSCVVKTFAIPCVRWRRKDELEMSEVHDEPEMLVMLPADEFAKLSHRHFAEDSCEDGLVSWIKKLQSEHSGINIHLFCHGLGNYSKSVKNQHSKKKRRNFTALPDLTSEQIEEVLVDVQIECKTTVSYTEKTEDVINAIKQITKSIGEAPYKRMKRHDIQFINEIPSIKINPKTGEGSKKAWGQMIQQFHNVTPVMATAITDKYPKLLGLVNAYDSCGCDTAKAELLLADIPVRRGVGTLQTNRRIGPELSYKIHKFLMSKDPDERLY